MEENKEEKRGVTAKNVETFEINHHVSSVYGKQCMSLCANNKRDSAKNKHHSKEILVKGRLIEPLNMILLRGLIILSGKSGKPQKKLKVMILSMALIFFCCVERQEITDNNQTNNWSQ